MPNFNHLKTYLAANMLSTQEAALVILMALGAHRLLADVLLFSYNVHVPSASAEWLPFDLLAIGVLVALTPVPQLDALPKTATQTGTPQESRLAIVKHHEEKRAA